MCYNEEKKPEGSGAGKNERKRRNMASSKRTEEIARRHLDARNDAKRLWADAKTDAEREEALGAFADHVVATPVSVLPGFRRRTELWYPSWLQEKDAAAFGTDRISLMRGVRNCQKLFHALKDACDAYIDKMEEPVCVYDGIGPHDEWQTQGERFAMPPGEFAGYVRDRRIVPVRFLAGEGREDTPLPEAEEESLAEKLDQCCWAEFTEEDGLFFGCGNLLWVGFLARYYRRSARFIVEEKRKRIAEGHPGRRALYRVGESVIYTPQDGGEAVTGRIREIHIGFGEDALEYQITRTEGDYHDLKIREEAIAGRADEPGIEEEDKA